MQTTANLEFKKPEGTDVVNIEDLNYNADIADTEIVKKASSSQDGRMAKEDKVKFDGISTGANKVEQSSTNGNIKIDGVEKKVYTPPTGTNPYGTTKADVGLGNVTNDAQVKRTEMGAASGVATLDSSGVNAQAPKAHTHTKSQITDFPSSLPANGGNSTTVNSHTANGTPATTEKTDIIKMINEVFQSGTNVKADAISAVNSKGGSLGSDATWDDIIAAINAIARGQGNAVESQVLSGVKFSNSDGQLRTGTMPNKGAITITPSGSDQTIPAGYHNGSGKVSAVTVPVANVLSGTTIAGQTGTMPNRGAVTLTPGTTDQTISNGYHNGSGIVKGDANLKTENIREDVSMFGKIGTLKPYELTAGDSNILFWDSQQYNTTSYTRVKVGKTITTNIKGKIRISFDLRCGGSASLAYEVDKNGSLVTSNSYNSTSWTTETIDVTCSQGDVFEFLIKSYNEDYNAYIKNIKVSTDLVSPLTIA
ncbi:hypothetical protein [Clostridium kluyveri]|uniref:hypothetical protein n=1 Tax=Clostridium kluyveri TaxID=1534 RepID=UPI000A8A6EF7|nr:hypothetical protein [Clostridium kluyveri]